jgi:hypothetical protein
MSRTVKISAALISAALLTSSSSARAGGWLADTFVKPFSPPAARALDKAHEKLGNPIDHAANAGVGIAVNSVAPGTGAAVTAGLEARRLAK